MSLGVADHYLDYGGGGGGGGGLNKTLGVSANESAVAMQVFLTTSR